VVGCRGAEIPAQVRGLDGHREPLTSSDLARIEVGTRRTEVKALERRRRPNRRRVDGCVGDQVDVKGLLEAHLQQDLLLALGAISLGRHHARAARADQVDRGIHVSRRLPAGP
jgi:hypothetical protein